MKEQLREMENQIRRISLCCGVRRARAVLSAFLIVNQILNSVFTYKSAKPLYLLVVLNAVPIICEGLLKESAEEEIMPALSREYRYSRSGYRNNMIGFILCFMLLLLTVLNTDGYSNWLATLPLLDLLAGAVTYIGCTVYYMMTIRRRLLWGRG